MLRIPTLPPVERVALLDLANRHNVTEAEMLARLIREAARREALKDDHPDEPDDRPEPAGRDADR